MKDNNVIMKVYINNNEKGFEEKLSKFHLDIKLEKRNDDKEFMYSIIGNEKDKEIIK